MLRRNLFLILCGFALLATIFSISACRAGKPAGDPALGAEDANASEETLAGSAAADRSRNLRFASDDEAADYLPYPESYGYWSRINLNRAPRSESSYKTVWTGSKAFFWGVSGLSGIHDAAIYDPARNSWSQINYEGSPMGIPGQTVVWTDKEVLVWGGNAPEGSVRGALYDLDSNTWKPISENGAPSPREHFVGVWSGSELIVWSGAKRNTGVREHSYWPDWEMLYDGAMYNPSTDMWRPISPQPDGIERRGFGIRLGSKMMLLPRYSQTLPPEQAKAQAREVGLLFDPESNSWDRVSLKGIDERDYNIIVAGETWIAFDTGCAVYGAAYDAETDSWRKINPIGAPSYMQQPLVSLCSGKVVVWGYPQDPLDSTIQFSWGSIYDPTNDRWMALNNSNSPDVTYRTVGLPMGDKVLVLGSTENGEPSGGIFILSPENLAKASHSFRIRGDTIDWRNVDVPLAGEPTGIASAYFEDDTLYPGSEVELTIVVKNEGDDDLYRLAAKPLVDEHSEFGRILPETIFIGFVKAGETVTRRVAVKSPRRVYLNRLDIVLSFEEARGHPPMDVKVENR
ncbi:MAG: hypothetical protein NUW37_05745 [Planctomycetes bacterium]|nr:hypothetical protein [Planctomycetota bacterium]